MTSQTEQEIITIHILPNISKSKGNKTIKFGQLKKILWDKYFSSNIMQKMRQGGWFQNFFLFFQNALYKVKENRQHLSFNIFW